MDLLRKSQEDSRTSLDQLLRLASDLNETYSGISKEELTLLNKDGTDDLGLLEERELLSKTLIPQLQMPDCNLLFMGLGSSGKTSVLNVLLGASVLPTSREHNTATLCEVRRGDVVYVESLANEQRKPEEKKRAAKTPVVTEQKFEQTFIEAKGLDIDEDLKKLVEIPPGETIPRFKCVRIKHPSPLLKVFCNLCHCSQFLTEWTRVRR